MTAGLLIILLIIGPVFVIWTYQMFRVLRRLRKRGEAYTGHHYPSLSETLRQWKIFLSRDEDAKARRNLLVSTLAMVLCIAALAMRQ